MLALIKKDVQLLSQSPVSYLLMSLIIFIFSVNEFTAFILIATMVSVFASLVYQDNKNKVTIFINSLPITMAKIIYSRYIFLGLSATVIVIFQWLISLGFNQPYDWRDYLLFLCLALISLAVILPIFYAVRNLYYAFTVIFVVFVGGLFTVMDLLVKETLYVTDAIMFNGLDLDLMTLAGKYIPFQPLIIIFCGTIILFWLSIKISVKLYHNRDV